MFVALKVSGFIGQLFGRSPQNEKSFARISSEPRTPTSYTTWFEGTHIYRKVRSYNPIN
jgi:hypothetical protein